jgi:hypothetical protein
MSSIRDLDEMWNGEVAERKSRLERGTYRGEITDYKLTQVGQNKTWALLVLVTIELPKENEGIEVEKCWYLTPKTMPYTARDLQELESGINTESPVSEQLQKLPLVGKEVDIRYDLPKDKDYPEVVWMRLSKNSAVIPQGAGDGVKTKTIPSRPITQHSTEKGNGYQPDTTEKDDIPF